MPWGAVLTVVRSDGGRQASEFYPVTSRLSQSAPYAFVAGSPTNPVVRLEVRWPSGRKVEYELPRQPGGTLWLNLDGSIRRGP
jgi:hypothetical protein